MKTASENEACQRLTEIPGVGPVTAAALIAAVGNGSTFQKGRNLSAWMGIVPGEYSTGGKQKLLGISKRGNKYLRRLFVQGAGRTQHTATATQAGSWSEPLVSAAVGAHPPECCRGGFGQQAGSHGLGGLM